MSIIRYDPLREAMQQMRHQLFHQHFEQPYEETQGTSGGWSPLVDVFEDSEGITLKVELPEVDANDVDIQLEGNALTLRGERKLENADKQERYHRVERPTAASVASSRCPRQWRWERHGAEPRGRAAYRPSQEGGDEAAGG
jgi:HSP20 family molecular chaperone IbpA